jgi:hypothetical protein
VHELSVWSAAGNHVKWRVAAGVVLALMAAACAVDPQGVSLTSTCQSPSDCPTELRFTGDGPKQSLKVSGNLTNEQPSRSFVFDAQANSQLHWSFNGPAVRVVLAGPDGSVTGPGLPPVVALPLAGRYVFSVSSNKMAEDIYGPFTLEMTMAVGL